MITFMYIQHVWVCQAGWNWIWVDIVTLISRNTHVFTLCVYAAYIAGCLWEQCVSLCGCTSVECVCVCVCVVITFKPSDEILSFLSASRQHEHMSMATSHKSRGKPLQEWNKKRKRESKRGMTGERKRERLERGKSSWKGHGEGKGKDRMERENEDW